MSIDTRFSGIVYGCTAVASISGLLLGWFPGADIPILVLIWVTGFALIIDRSGVSKFSDHWFRFLLTIALAGGLFIAGVSIVNTLSLPIFFIVNPILDGLSTYRMMRSAAKLYARKDAEENVSSSFTVLTSMLGDVAILIGAFLGLDAE